MNQEKHHIGDAYNPSQGRLNGGQIGQGSIDVTATKVAPSVCGLFHAYTTDFCSL